MAEEQRASATTENNQGAAETEEAAALLDRELHVIRKLRLAFQASLHLLEAARDDLVAMGERVERLTVASRQCREQLLAKRENEAHSPKHAGER